VFQIHDKEMGVRNGNAESVSGRANRSKLKVLNGDFRLRKQRPVSQHRAMNVEPAWKTYLKIGIAMTPTLIFGLFFMVVNFPKAEAILRKAGLLGDSPSHSTALFRLIISLSYLVFSNLNLILLALACALTALEIWVPSWARMRRPICVVGAVLFNAFVLLGMTATTVTAFLAIGMLQRAQ
jgi:hypothetical protein